LTIIGAETTGSSDIDWNEVWLDSAEGNTVEARIAGTPTVGRRSSRRSSTARAGRRQVRQHLAPAAAVLHEAQLKPVLSAAHLQLYSPGDDLARVPPRADDAARVKEL